MTNTDLPSASTDACPACLNPATGSSKSGRLSCPSCGTVSHEERRAFHYNDSYPEERAHQADHIKALKQKSLAAWLQKAHIKPSGIKVLEVGFGGGATLEYLKNQTDHVFGLEVVESNRRSAKALGIPENQIVEKLEDLQGRDLHFDLFLYCDSFEHLLDPRSHLKLLNEISRPGSKALLVLPRADCLSRKWMGSYWPHDLPDHWIFYSQEGLTRLWNEFGWTAVSTFHPTKYVSSEMAIKHASMKLPVNPDWVPKALRNIHMPLNFGELGIVFEKS